MSNSIDDEGAKSLSQGLLKNDGLTVLDLSFNKISDEGGIAIANSLRANRKLERLLLRDNNLHDSTGQLLVEVTRYNRSLLKASLEKNPINYKYVSEIKTNLKRNYAEYQRNLVPMLKRQIKSMQIRDNALDDLLVDLEKRKTEETDAEIRLQKQAEIAEKFKVDEEAKYQEVRSEYESVRAEHASLADELSHLEDRHRQITLKGEQEIQSWEDKIASMAADLNKLTKDNATTRQDFSLKRSQNQLKLDAVQQILDEKQADKRRVEYSIKILREQIDKQKAELEQVHKPEEEAKTFLASEKLASSKKPNRRAKSASRARSARPKQRGGR
jgi:chromosome segregation ATPase